MASTTDGSGSTDGSTSGSGGIVDSIISFVTKPLGMGLVAGVAIMGFLAWRVF